MRLRWRWTHPVQLVLGPIVWSVWFVVLYGGLSLGCQLVAPPGSDHSLTWLNLAVVGGGVLVAAALAWAGLRCWRSAPEVSEDGCGSEERFVARTGGLIWLFSAMASAFIALPGMAMVPCL